MSGVSGTAALIILLSSMAAHAQQASRSTAEPPLIQAQSGPDAPGAFGTSALNIYSVAANAMVPSTGSTAYSFDMSRRRIMSSGSGHFVAPVLLPSGAFITGIQLEACDLNPSAEIILDLYACPTASAFGCSIPLASVTTGLASATGCGLVLSTTPIAAPTVDNDNFRYELWLRMGSSVGLAAGAARIAWRRQVTPAPASASFADVPVGHPFHRFVEALAAAGITGGCGGGNYCPNDPLTRGQMAVFLSAALGLHWAN